ncbi:MAG: type VI secretion system-associated FHA domain protein [Pseudomonadota bacterium]
MRLILELMTGPQKGARREIGDAEDFCVGTLPDAAWRLPIEEGDGAIWLRSDSEGFYFVAEGAVALEGHPVRPGSPVQIGHQANLDVAGHGLRAAVEHRGERHAPLLQGRSGEGPTITSILSDVAPGGASASSTLPGRAGESWMAEFGIASSRGPAALTRQAGAAPRLPDDWNASGERMNRLAQSSASTSAVKLMQKPDRAETAAADGALLEAFRRGAGLPEDAGRDDPEALLALAGRVLRQMIDGLAEAEAAGRSLLVDHDLAAPPTALNQQPEADVAAILAGPGAEGRMTARLDAIAAHQRTVAAALEIFVARARDALDPAAVETRLDARGRRSLVRSRAADCWEDYRRAWQGEDVGPAPLSAEAFAAIMRSIDDSSTRNGEGSP